MLVAALVAVIVGLLVVIWSQRRQREARLSIQSQAALEELLPSLAGLSHGLPIGGNAAEVLENGEFFDAFLADVDAAQRSVHLETYIWAEGEASRRVVAALAAAAARGVQIRVLVDAYGGKDMGEAARRDLEAAGCKLEVYRRGRLKNLGLQNARDHRKLIVIDGRIGFVGGHCIKDNWLGDAGDPERYRDVSVRVRGPILHALQATFGENWVEATGELFVGEDVFPEQEAAGEIVAHVARVKPAGAAPPAVRILYHVILCLARRRIYIQNPYFLPGADAMAALARAVERGVDVRVMVPAARVSDMPFVQHAAHRNFAALLAGGVRVLEYQRTLLHQKIITIDGVWSVIGSANFDERSLGINDEVVLGLLDQGLARKFEEIFLHDMEQCVELSSEQWAGRGFWHRWQDEAVHVLKDQL